MARNEEGEFELVLGNRQLVSVFFVVVILLGAFFMMGYVIGRGGSSSTVNADGSVKSPAPTKSAQLESSVSARPAESEAAPAKSAVVDEAAKPSPAPAPVSKNDSTREEVAQAEPTKDTARKKETPAPEKPAAVEQRVAVGEPRPGQKFLQVAATSRADAEIVAETLAKRGFKTVLGPAPKGTLVRVLVGPLKDAADLAETRARLEAASMKPIVQIYK